jgi:hypothetical protein
VTALSGHRTPQAARLYVKRTEHQRLRAAREAAQLRRSERNGDESRLGGRYGESTWNKKIGEKHLRSMALPTEPCEARNVKHLLGRRTLIGAIRRLARTDLRRPPLQKMAAESLRRWTG